MQADPARAAPRLPSPDGTARQRRHCWPLVCHVRRARRASDLAGLRGPGSWDRPRPRAARAHRHASHGQAPAQPGARRRALPRPRAGGLRRPACVSARSLGGHRRSRLAATHPDQRAWPMRDAAARSCRAGRSLGAARGRRLRRPVPVPGSVLLPLFVSRWHGSPRPGRRAERGRPRLRVGTGTPPVARVAGRPRVLRS